MSARDVPAHLVTQLHQYQNKTQFKPFLFRGAYKPAWSHLAPGDHDSSLAHAHELPWSWQAAAHLPCPLHSNGLHGTTNVMFLPPPPPRAAPCPVLTPRHLPRTHPCSQHAMSCPPPSPPPPFPPRRARRPMLGGGFYLQLTPPPPPSSAAGLPMMVPPCHRPTHPHDPAAPPPPKASASLSRAGVHPRPPCLEEKAQPPSPPNHTPHLLQVYNNWCPAHKPTAQKIKQSSAFWGDGSPAPSPSPAASPPQAKVSPPPQPHICLSPAANLP
jgi:hypothetical protein